MTYGRDDVLEKRLRRISLLAAELNEKCQQNTDAARMRCIHIAGELIELFKAEDAYRRGVPLPIGRRPSPS